MNLTKTEINAMKKMIAKEREEIENAKMWAESRNLNVSDITDHLTETINAIEEKVIGKEN